MTKLFEHAVETVRGLSPEVQDELACVLLQLAGVEHAPIQLTPEEKVDLAEADAEILRGDIATDEKVRAIWAKHRL